MSPSLTLKEFGLCFGHKVVLADITLSLPASGITVLMGSVGTGKSSLLCSLVGVHQNNPRFKYWGEVTVAGNLINLNAPTSHQAPPILVRQQINQLTESLQNVILSTAKFSSVNNAVKHAFITQLIEDFDVPELLPMLQLRFIDVAPLWQRIALILASSAINPPLLMIDEPTYSLSTQDVVRIKQFIKRLATKIKLLVVLHSQEQAQNLADDIVLIAGGRVQFNGAASTFFAKEPPNSIVEQFVKTGSVSIAAPDARRENLADDAVPPPPLPQAALDAIRSFGKLDHPAETTQASVNAKTTAPINTPANIQSSATTETKQDEKLKASVAAIHAKKEAMKQQASSQQILAQQQLAQENLAKENLAKENLAKERLTQEKMQAVPAVDTSTQTTDATKPSKQATLTTEPVKQLLELPAPSADGVSIVAEIGKHDTSVSRGPNGFSWIVPGMIGGCPMPGVSSPMSYDLDLLANIGITVLITLTEEDIYQAELKAAGLSNVHLPIYDREAPSLSQMHMLLLKMQRLITQGEVLAVHCLAGLGRTGTVLAAWMIKEGGLSAEEAIRRLRLINPGFIQSVVQETFLAEFENDILRRMR